MIIEFEINGARVIVTGENLSVSVSQDAEPASASRGDNPTIVDHAPTGEAIKAFRKAMGFRQHQFCKLFGVVQATVSRWETGAERPHGSAAIILHKMMREAA